MEHESPNAWFELEPGEEFIRFDELAHRFAKAMHPVSPEDGECDYAYGFARVQFDEELTAAVESDSITPRNPLTRGKHAFPFGAALDSAVINLQDLRAFATERNIGVRVRTLPPEHPPACSTLPHFTTEARPRDIPSELLALPADAQVSFECRIGCERSSGVTHASDYRDSIRETIARQAEGHFTLNEAAQVLADSRPGLDPLETVKRFRLAHSKGELPIHQGGSRFPLEVGETIREFLDTVEVGELDAWLRASVGYGFPSAEGASLTTPAVRASVTQEPAPDRGRRVKRAALIADNVRRWPTIERDLKDAASNGLSEAAKDGAAVGWWWEGSAVEWARARAKVQDIVPGLAGMTGTIHRMRG